MTNQTSGTNLHALLIGVDCYLPNPWYGSLGGCVRDITQVEEFLRNRLGMPAARIFKLTATNTGTEEPSEPRTQWPTYENMVEAFEHLTDAAQPGDLVYVHYSGHGGRTPTKFPNLKGPDGLDESLVPTDIGNDQARYLRDIEMAHILKTMVDKGLVVTLVLDSCHSGGATRGKGGGAVRGSNVIDRTPRPLASLVASDDELAATWRTIAAGATRDLKLGSGWLPEPQGYALLAACRPSEFANEWPFDGQNRNGALTYWLLDSLKDMRPSLTYQHLHDRIVAKVHSQFSDQTPQLQGEGNRVVFGSAYVQLQEAVNVMQVDAAKKRAQLNTGQAQGVRKGTQFAVYPPGQTDFAQVDQRLALVEIAELGATESWATVTATLRDVPIEQGAQAVLVDAGSVRLYRKVRLFHREDIPATIDQDAALERVKQAIATGGAGWLDLAGAEGPAHYQVAVNAAGEYEIWDPAGRPFPNLRPPLQISAEGAAAGVVRRLVHLAKYHNIQQLDNHDDWSPLVGKLVVELTVLSPDYDPADPPEPQPFDDPGNAPILDYGDWVCLRIRNESSQVLNVTLLDLKPAWGIDQVWPQRADYEPLDPGQEKLLPLRVSLPDKYPEGTDVLKVVGTVGAANWRWLELPNLDQPLTRSAGLRGRSPSSPLEALMAVFTADQPKTRDVNPAAHPSEEWVSAQVELRVRRP